MTTSIIIIIIYFLQRKVYLHFFNFEIRQNYV